VDADKPIIVVKKKGGHGARHGGAWKIAYADFVTAMMAFFLVIWLVNSASTPTKENIASYFKRPGLFQEGSGTPLEIGGSGILDDAYVPSSPEEKKNEVGESQIPRQKGFEEGDLPLSKEIEGQKVFILPPTPKPARHTEDDEGEILEELLPENQPTPAVNLTVVPTSPPAGATAGPGGTPAAGGTLEAETAIDTPAEMAEAVEQAMESSPELESILGAVEVSADADTLNIEIMDTEKASMFASGSAYVREDAREAFSVIAKALSRVNKKVEIIGHTDARPFSSRRGGYSNWELSVDRANSARRLLVADGVDQSRITGVQGRADTELKNKADPFAASNRRITLRMKFDVKKPPPAPTVPAYSINGRSAAAATGKKQELPSYTQNDDEEEDIEVPEPLDRVHTLSPGQVLDNMQRNREQPKTGAPSPRSGSGNSWQDPKFFGEK